MTGMEDNIMIYGVIPINFKIQTSFSIMTCAIGKTEITCISYITDSQIEGSNIVYKL